MGRRFAIPLLSLATAGAISLAAFARPVRWRSPDPLWKRMKGGTNEQTVVDLAQWCLRAGLLLR
jgi:hypothetical protein